MYIVCTIRFFHIMDTLCIYIGYRMFTGNYPLAVPVLENNFFVDDAMFGSNNKNLLRQTRDQLIDLLKSGNMELRKWASNSKELLQDIPEANHGLAISKDLKQDKSLKVLGIAWNPATDTLYFKISRENLEKYN